MDEVHQGEESECVREQVGDKEEKREKEKVEKKGESKELSFGVRGV